MSTVSRYLVSWLHALVLIAVLPVHAHEGVAHGLDDEHVDAPVATSVVAASASARLEANSEDFELVATLGGSELSVLVDRYETNEPVHNGQLEVESGELTAVAKFDSDHGVYAFDDPKLLAELAKPGTHPLVFTITAGEEVDLLEGLLVVQPAAGATSGQARDASGKHPPGEDPGWLRPVGIAAVAVALLGFILWMAMRRYRRKADDITKA
jgi:hypothetical protein